jgi:tyrosyl-tRNA synthetase
VYGMWQGQEKMSKSDPNSAIFMEDSAQEVMTKIKKAFCPPGVVEGNPCLAYVKLIIFPWFGFFEVTRDEANGGNRWGPIIEAVVAGVKKTFSQHVPKAHQV